MNLKKSPKRVVALPIFLVVSTLLSGIAGYMWIEGWSFVDSLYMTVTTLTTVGFGEVHPLSLQGRIFTVMLILFGVGIAAYTLTNGVQAIVRGEVGEYRRFLKMQKTLSELKGHTIVCGMGRLGRSVARELKHANAPFVVIDLKEEVLSAYEAEGTPVVHGRATEDENLIAAGIVRAKSLLTLLPDDADNVYVTLCARALNPEINIIARTESESGDMKLRRAGATHVFFPYRVTGVRIANTVLRPNVSDFLEVASLGSKRRLVLEELVVPEGSPLVGKTLAESNLRKETGAVIAAIVSSTGAMHLSPGATDHIEGGSTLIVLGEEESLKRLSSRLVGSL